MVQVIKTYCDNGSRHPEDEPPTDAEAGLYLIPPMPSVREMDLCEQCRDGLSGAELVALAVEIGRKPSAQDKRPAARAQQPARAVPAAQPRVVAPMQQAIDSLPRDYPCLLCDRPPLADQTSLAGHYRNAHGLPEGWHNPTCGITECPLCGKEFGGPTGIGQHAPSAHGTRTVAQALRKAQDEGDQFGVVKRAVQSLVDLGAVY